MKRLHFYFLRKKEFGDLGLFVKLQYRNITCTRFKQPNIFTKVYSLLSIYLVVCLFIIWALVKADISKPKFPQNRIYTFPFHRTSPTKIQVDLLHNM